MSNTSYCFFLFFASSHKFLFLAFEWHCAALTRLLPLSFFPLRSLWFLSFLHHCFHYSHLTHLTKDPWFCEMPQAELTFEYSLCYYQRAKCIVYSIMMIIWTLLKLWENLQSAFYLYTSQGMKFCLMAMCKPRLDRFAGPSMTLRWCDNLTYLPWIILALSPPMYHTVDCWF